jgi:hypothetical protein
VWKRRYAERHIGSRRGLRARRDQGFVQWEARAGLGGSGFHAQIGEGEWCKGLKNVKGSNPLQVVRGEGGWRCGIHAQRGERRSCSLQREKWSCGPVGPACDGRRQGWRGQEGCGEVVRL